MTGPAQPGGSQAWNQQPWPPYPWPPRRETNGLAITALVLGIIWLGGLGALLAITLGAVALRQVRRTGDSGRGLAIAGVTLGIVGIVLPAALIAASIALGTGSRSGPTAVFEQTPPAQPTVADLPSCAPAPCADYHGFVLKVTAVNRNFQPGPGGVDTPGAGFHIVRVTITFDDIIGEHGYNEGFDLSLVDATGAVQDNLGAVYGEGCPTFLPSAQDMAPGGHAGPFTICYPAGGSPSGPLALAWTPDVNMAGCTQQPAGIAVKPTGELVHTDGCDAVLLSLQP